MADSVTIVSEVLGPRLKTIRTQRGVSVGRVYQRLSISRATLHRLDNGHHDIRVSDLQEYADLLGYDLVLKPKNG